MRHHVARGEIRKGEGARIGQLLVNDNSIIKSARFYGVPAVIKHDNIMMLFGEGWKGLRRRAAGDSEKISGTRVLQMIPASVKKHIPFAPALTMQSSSQSFYPPPGSVLRKSISPLVFFSGGVLSSQRPVVPGKYLSIVNLRARQMEIIVQSSRSNIESEILVHLHGRRLKMGGTGHAKAGTDGE